MKSESFFIVPISRRRILVPHCTIESCRQFHQCFLRAFFVRKLHFAAFSSQKKALSYEKNTRKMLMKLAPGLNFINVQHTAFTPADRKSVKNNQVVKLFYAFVIYERKSCSKNVGKIDTWREWLSDRNVPSLFENLFLFFLPIS